MDGKTLSKCLYRWGLAVFLSFFLFFKTIESQEKPGLSQTGSPYSSSYALVIGIENYQNDKSWPPPDNASRDAILVGNELEKLGFKVTYRTNLDLNELDQTLTKFFYNNMVDTESRLFIWYSGYAQTIDGESFLVPSDAPQKDDPGFKIKAYPVRRFHELSKLTKAKYVYMVFNACISSSVFINNEKSNSQVVASILKKRALQYICSCATDQQGQTNKIFRDMFINILRNDVNANANSDNYLTASEIGSFIKKYITDTIGRKNEGPHFGWLENFEEGEFVFLLPGTALKCFHDELKNGTKGPEMVEIPGGTFKMGDLQDNGYLDERPVHNVNVSGIAVGRYEITFEEYDRYCDAKNPKNNLQTEPKKSFDNGWGREKRPVINISWEEAIKYTEWLSEQTGYLYRLPTEAEWEYFARAGTNTDYWWGNEIGAGNANCYDCDTRWVGKKKTNIVGFFGCNRFGIYDTVGNVWEWTCSEYTDKYDGKETKCLEKIATGGEVVVIRGGSWNEEYGKCRVSHRKLSYPGERSQYIGFRVVRELK